MVILDEILKIISSYYELEPIKEITPFNGGTANKFYIVETQDSRYILKLRNPRYSDEEWLLFEHRLIEHVFKKNMYVFPSIPTRDGKEWIRINSRVYELFPYIEGTYFNPDNTSQLKDAGYTLAKFHLATEDFPYKNLKSLSRYDSPLSIRKGIDIIKNDIDRAFIDLLYGIVEDIEKYLPDEVYWGLPLFIIHGDYHPANLKFRGNRVVGIFDLDWTSLQPRVRDLADGILYFASKRGDLINGGNIYLLTQACQIDMECSRIFVESYKEILSIDKGEIIALPWFIKARWIFSRIDAAVRKVPQEERGDFIKNGLLEPLYWLEDHKEEFTKKLIE
jgi:homoserine kinase type II